MKIRIAMLLMLAKLVSANGIPSLGSAESGEPAPSVVIVGSYDVGYSNAQALRPPYANWTALPGLPWYNSVRGCQSACLDGQVYVGTTYTLDHGFYALNLTSGVWGTRAQPNQLLSTPAAAAHGGLAYFAGGIGYDAQTSLRIVQFYDPGQDSWGAIADMAEGRNRAGMAAVGDALVVCGGFSSISVALNTCESYSFTAKKWKPIAPMSIGRGGFNMVTYQGLVYALGSMEGVECERYDPRTGVWEALPDMPTFRRYFGTFEVEGRVCAGGGIDRDGKTILASVDCFDVAAGAWVTGEPELKFAEWAFAITQC